MQRMLAMMKMKEPRMVRLGTKMLNAHKHRPTMSLMKILEQESSNTGYRSQK
jgi:hypothetical protein